MQINPETSEGKINWIVEQIARLTDEEHVMFAQVFAEKWPDLANDVILSLDWELRDPSGLSNQ